MWIVRPDPDPFKNLLAIALPKIKFFKKLPVDSVLSIYCVVYSELGRPEISIETDIVKGIASIGAALDFDLYTLDNV